MKKSTLLTLVLVSFCFSLVSHAQGLNDSLKITSRALRPYDTYKLGIGGRLGVSGMADYSLSAKYFLTPKSALHFTFGKAGYTYFSALPLASSLLFERHHFLFHSRKFRFVYGGGITILLAKRRPDATWVSKRFGTEPTLEAGFEYNLHRSPLSLGTDARLFYYYQDRNIWPANPEKYVSLYVHYTLGKN